MLEPEKLTTKINNSHVSNSKVNSPRKKTMDEASILLNLKKSMKIKQIKLRNDEEREKLYLKRILQEKMCSIHPNDDSYFCYNFNF